MNINDLYRRLRENDGKPLPVMMAVEHYRQDTVIRFRNMYQKMRRERGSSRGRIERFSYRSRRRGRLVLRSIAHQMQYEFGLTYPGEYPVDGAECKRHLQALRQWLTRRGVRFFWLIEFQARGAPHFHGLADREVDPWQMAQAWYRIVGSGDLRHLYNGCHVAPIRDRNRIASYYTTYLSKLEQKAVPAGFDNVGRFWGYTRSLVSRTVEVFEGAYTELCATLRNTRRWYQAACRNAGWRWRWRGKGATIWGLGKEQREFMADRGITILHQYG